MPSSRIRALIPLAAVLTLSLLAPAPALAADAPAAPIHVRTAEPHAATLIAEALSGSPTFRLLLDRLNDSDVIVYVRIRALRPSVDGQLTFVGPAGGRRYVVVTLAWGRTRLRQIAALGHELQHAVEIAERREIVDDLSLAEYYETAGIEGAREARRRSFDTRAAVLAGNRVQREMLE